MNDLFSVADIDSAVDAEPRIKDVLLADRLGYKRSRGIRELIERNRAELECYGTIAVRHGAVEIGSGAIKGVDEFYLNEHQSLLLCMFSKTDMAAAVRKALIDVFVAYRHAHVRQSPPVLEKDVQTADDLKLRKVNTAIRCFGDEAGGQLWVKLGLEWVPAMARTLTQADLFDSAVPPGSVTITVTPDRKAA
ncbi:MAG: hypothetical protein QM681_17430 [Novosphingobium sp.]